MNQEDALDFEQALLVAQRHLFEQFHLGPQLIDLLLDFGHLGLNLRDAPRILPALLFEEGKAAVGFFGQAVEVVKRLL